MALSPGTKLGPHEVVSLIGAGGMGEVYRARDTRLGRTVALKVLSARFSGDAILRERFEREARVISSLSHPHICALYDIGRQEGLDYLVLEYLEGETLEHCLRRGALATEQLLQQAIEIADALDKAHRRGITHRDLKPGNIMLTKSGAKLMDFGLAKLTVGAGLAPPARAQQAAPLQEMPTADRKLTQEGTLLGTLAYMAPEQLEGKDADARTDIFAFGTVLYEMATGKPAFSGKSSASLIASILTSEPPPLASLQPLAPPGIGRLVKHCLAKDPEERWQSASDLLFELKALAEEPQEVAAVSPAAMRGVRRERVAWIAALVALAALAMLFAFGNLRWPRSSDPARLFSVALPMATHDMAISPDGRMLVFVGPFEGRHVLWLHQIGTTNAVTADIDGTNGASYPFWSPDSRFVGFFAGGKLKKISVEGGPAQTICSAPIGRGGAWGRDGTILFAKATIGLCRVSAGGGTPIEVTQPDRLRGEASHRWPVFLPDGHHYLYLATTFAGPHEEVSGIYAASLESKERRLVVRANSNVAYAPPGYLVYVREQALVAQRFDERGLRAVGEPVPLVDRVQFLPGVARALFSVSETGLLTYQKPSPVGASQLVWFNRSGKQVGAVGQPGRYYNPRISPDGKRVAVDLSPTEGLAAIWLYDVAGGGAARITFDPAYDAAPVWAPDGSHIVYATARAGPGTTLFEKAASGAGDEEPLLTEPDRAPILGMPSDWSRDGRYILVASSSPDTGGDLVLLPLRGTERKPVPFLQTKADERDAQFSPDGHWVVYSSNESGNWEVYVIGFRAPGSAGAAEGKWQVSTGGGREPRWRRDGKQLFYLAPDNKLMSIDVKPGPAFEARPPKVLFQAHPPEPIAAEDLYTYDVSPDGQRFLVETEVETNASPISIILNWPGKLSR